MRMSIVARVCAAVVLVGVTDMADGFDRQGDDPFASRSEVIAPHGMAATSQPLATQIALDILKAGGSAVDAAIAANAALGLMEPTGCGIGGDLFAIVWDGTAKRLHGLNASGRSPRALSLEYFREQGLERIPGNRGDRLALGAQRRNLAGLPWFCRGIHACRQSARKGRGFSQSASCRHLPQDCRGWS